MEHNLQDIPLIIGVLSGVLLIAPFVAQTLKIPLAVIEILFGSIIGYMGILHGNAYVPLIAKTGFLFLMFLAGMEVNLKNFLTIKSSLFKRAIGYFFILYTLSALIVWFFHYSIIYLVALPIVSLGMIMALIKEVGKEEAWIKLTLMIGIFGELISITALTLLSGVLEYGLTIDFLRAIGILILFLIASSLLYKFAAVIFWWYPNLRKSIMPDNDNSEKDIRLSMAFFFAMIGLMISLGLDMVLGAFIAGIFITTFFKHKVDLPHKLSSLGFGFLVPIFFIYVGSTVNLEAMINPEIMLLALQILGIMLAIRIISSMVYLQKLGLKGTLMLAMGDSMPLTFLLAIATIGEETKSIGSNEYYALVIAGMIGSIIMMSTIKLIIMFDKKRASH